MPEKRRKRKPQTPFQKELKQFRKLTSRHVLCAEADMDEDLKRKIFHEAEKLRKAGNQLTAVFQKRLDQLYRTKKYRNLQLTYKEAKEKGHPEQLAEITESMNAMQEEYGLSWNQCRTDMIVLRNKYSLSSVSALARAEDIWAGIQKVLFGNGKRLHFLPEGNLPCIRAKQPDREIIIKSGKDGRLSLSWKQKTFSLIEKDDFIQNETGRISGWLESPEEHDRKALSLWKKTGEIIDTFRPCYASFVCKVIRGRLRVFVHITVEGNPVFKTRKDGSPRHIYRSGQVGVDNGTQSFAYTSFYGVGLKNHSERGMSIKKREARLRRIRRAMDRSRRASNPQNYNEDGTIRAGRTKWVYSSRYRKLKEKSAELSRICAENRKYACNENVNHLRSLGDTVIIEEKNAARLARKAKPGSLDKNGKPARRKRFGRSVASRCPGYFQKRLKDVFTATGGTYIEVSRSYRASQYDHTADEYIPKGLSQRMYRVQDGTLVQRDWYSSFLLYCYDQQTGAINKERCGNSFSHYYDMELDMIERIVKTKTRILNSGIRV